MVITNHIIACYNLTWLMIAHLAVHKRQGGGRLGHGTGIIPIVLHKNLACVESVCQLVKSQARKPKISPRTAMTGTRLLLQKAEGYVLIPPLMIQLLVMWSPNPAQKRTSSKAPGTSWRQFLSLTKHLQPC